MDEQNQGQVPQSNSPQFNQDATPLSSQQQTPPSAGPTGTESAKKSRTLMWVVVALVAVAVIVAFFYFL